MLNNASVMERYEYKYLLDADQTEYLRRRLKGHMQPDAYGRTSIASLYYDTPDRRLIRRSLERPAFKEKLRLRSYGLASENSPVYLELKRKASGIVYKRRVQCSVGQAAAFISVGGLPGKSGQISRELAAFRANYRALEPACLIIYDRTAYFEPDGDLRLTIDESPRYRTQGLDLTLSMDGQLLLEVGWMILEVKLQQAMPLWLSAILSEGGIFKSSFSKYGEAYTRQLSDRQRRVCAEGFSPAA